MNTNKIKKLCDIFIGSSCVIAKNYDTTLVTILYKNTVVYEEFFSREITDRDLDDMKRALL